MSEDTVNTAETTEQEQQEQTTAEPEAAEQPQPEASGPVTEQPPLREVKAEVSAMFKRRLAVPLTMDRMVEHVHDLARVTNSISALEGEADELARARKGVVGQIDGARERQSAIIRTLEKGEEQADVDCLTVKLFDTNTLRVIRQDTQEVIEERPLSYDERQALLFEGGEGDSGEQEEADGAEVVDADNPVPPPPAEHVEDDAPPVAAGPDLIAGDRQPCTKCKGAGGFIANGKGSGSVCKHCGGSGDEPVAELTTDEADALLHAIAAEG